MKLIPLSQGLFAMVDDADFEAVSQFKWCVRKDGRNYYAVRKIRRQDGSRATQYLHKFLMPGATEVHHIDGNSLNDQKETNLRSVTSKQNHQGFKRKRLGTTAKFRGVSWDKRARKWRAGIKVNDKSIYLGCFIDAIDAARAYDSAAVFYFGEWASTNFPVGEISIT